MSSKQPTLAEQERRLALVIGVNDAPLSHLAPLNYAINDAEAMAETLQEHCGFTLLRPSLLGAEASSANIRRAVLSLARARSDNDFLLLYFSGHGQPMSIGGGLSDIYLVTSDFSEADTEADETLHCSMRWLQEKLYLPTQAGKVLLILDCCYAGNMGRTAPDPYLEDLKTRINTYFGAPGTLSGARSGGLRLALTATGHNQAAREHEGYGVMTGRLLECLQGKIDDVIDLNDRGNISLQRLHDYLLRVMPAGQDPSVSGDYAGQKCILAQYEKRAIELRQHKRALINNIPRSYIPLARLASFQTRPGEFDRVGRLLFTEETDGVSSQARVVGLVGMGGIGKTRLAVEIAYEYKERFAAGTFWMAVAGTSLSEWQHQFAEMAANTEYLPPGDDVSHPENEARRARHIACYLAPHPDALLVLDNIERIDLLFDALTTFAGEEARCTILYTSRTPETPASVNKYAVSALPDEGALRLLLERRPASFERIFADANDPEAKAARDICQYVERLPLALTLLRDLLQDPHLSLTYLDQQLRGRGALDITREGDVNDTKLFHTFLLSWQNVRNPDAQCLFQLASFFPEAAPIPLWLLALSAKLEGDTSIEPLGRARLELVRWSLVEELPDNALRLHPIIREFARHLMAQGSERDVLLGTVREQLTREFTNINNLERRVVDEGYWTCLERVQEVVTYAQQLGLQQVDMLECVAYWLARDSSLLGAGALWPDVLPGLFYQQLHNRALEEGYHLPGAEPDVYWVRQQSRAGTDDQSLLGEFRHPNGVTCVAFSPDSRLVATGCEDCCVRIWDAGNGQMMQVLVGHDTPTTGVAFSPDGSQLITCSLYTNAKLWDVLNGQLVRVFDAQEYALRDVVFSPDSRYIAARSEDRCVRVWDVMTGEIVAVLVGQSHWIGGFAFSPDSKQIAIISSPISPSSTIVDVWDREDGRIVTTLKSGASWDWDNVEHVSIVFFPDGNSLLFGLQHNIYMWEIGQQKASICFSTNKLSREDIIGTVFSADGKQVAVIGSNEVEVWQVQDKQVVLSTEHNTKVMGVAFSLDSARIVTGSSDGIARVWKVPHIFPVKMTVQPSFEAIECAVFSPTGKQLLTTSIVKDKKISSQGIIRVWDTIDGELVRTLQEGSKYIDYVVLSPDGKRVAMKFTGGIWTFNTERDWDVEEGQVITHNIPLQFFSGTAMSCIALSPDGINIAAGMNGVIYIWNLNTWERIALLYGYQGDVEQIAFSPDGSKLAAGATDATARIWDVRSGAQLAVLKGYAGGSLAISPDSRMLAVGLLSNAMYVSSIENGARLVIFEGHTQPVTMLSFSPAGRLLLSADQSGLVLFWRVDTCEQAVKTPLGIYLAASGLAAVHWYDEQHVLLADLGGVQHHPRFYHLALEGG